MTENNNSSKRVVKPNEIRPFMNTIKSIMDLPGYEEVENKVNFLAYNLLIRGYRHENNVSKEVFDDVMNIFKGEDK